MTTRAAIAGGLVFMSCSRPVQTGPECVEQSAAAVAPATPVGVLQTPVQSGIRLWEQPARFSGPRRVGRSAVEWTGVELASWLGTVAGQRTYTSPVLLELAVPDALELSMRSHGAPWVDVLTATSQVPTEEDRRMRMQRVALPSGASGVVTVQVPVTSVLQENWRDEQEAARLARLELRFAPSESPAELLQVRWLPDRESTGEAPVVLASLEHDGVRRPGWAIHPAGKVEVDVSLLADTHAFVAWVAADAPSLMQVSVGDAWVETVGVQGGWQRIALELPALDEGAVLTLENTGAERVRVGSPRLSAPTPTATNVLIYLADTLRADHIGVGSADVSVTPTVDRLAREGAWFAQAQSTGSWTKPVIPTVLTGQWPMQHGVGLFSITDRLAPSTPTLQAAVGRAGYRVGSFSASPMGSTLSGLEVGFDVAVPPVHWSGAVGPLGHPSATQVHDALLSWIDADPDAPWAAYVHTLEPHAWAQPLYGNGTPDSYRAAVADMDAQLGALLSALEARDVLDNTLIVFLSDHGESFGEHGVYGHGTALSQAQTHVPLVFWLPGTVPTSVQTQPVSLADVAPTVLELLGLPQLTTADGQSLVTALSGRPTARSGVPAARMRYVQQPESMAMFSWVALDGRKLITHDGTADQYELAHDPCETAPRSPDPVVEQDLQDWKRRHQDQWLRPVNTPLSASDASLLSTLGYVEE